MRWPCAGRLKTVMVPHPEPARSADSLSEFALIRRFFAELGAPRADVALGVGDDCALLQIEPGQALAVSIDTLSAGVHFFADCDPEAIAHKALAVGLSDLAAMGAEPAWATLALTLPEVDANWLRRFSAGFAALATAHGVHLVGGDTTRGPLSVTVQVHGLVPPAQALKRSGAQPGDQIWVSGTLGDAALALRLLEQGRRPDEWLRARLERPTPRVELGRGLRTLAHALIDLSDGLAADLGHVLAASGVGAEIALARIPLSEAVAAVLGEGTESEWVLPLASGDDYELCFCAPPDSAPAIRTLAARCACQVTPIGVIQSEPGVRWRHSDGRELCLTHLGHDHFR